MNQNKSDTYKTTKKLKLISVWPDKKIYLFHYRVLELYVRHGAIVEKIHEIVSFN